MSSTRPSLPEFRPSLQQFADFNKYIKKVEKLCGDVGAVKIIPPKGWVPNRRGYSDIKDTFMIKKPVRQIAIAPEAGAGPHRLTVVLEVVQKQMTANEFYAHNEANENNRSNKERAMTNAKDYDGLQEAFWKNVSRNPAIYGADSPGTLFDPECTAWNLSSLNSILDLAGAIPGVNSPMLYMGMWKAFFAWHVEDMNLCSINYVHIGQPKQWYCIAPSQAAKFEEIAHRLFPSNHKECSEFIRHKQSIITPTYLEQHGIKVHVATQQAGEFIVLFPKVYHCGFNYGFNCAEAVNFATESWIPAGRDAKWCECRPAVTILMDEFEKKLRAYRKWQLAHTAVNTTKPRRRRISIDDEDDAVPMAPVGKSAVASSTSDISTHTGTDGEWREGKNGATCSPADVIHDGDDDGSHGGVHGCNSMNANITAYMVETYGDNGRITTEHVGRSMTGVSSPSVFTPPVASSSSSSRDHRSHHDDNEDNDGKEGMMSVTKTTSPVKVIAPMPTATPAVASSSLASVKTEVVASVNMKKRRSIPPITSSSSSSSSDSLDDFVTDTRVTTKATTPNRTSHSNGNGNGNGDDSSKKKRRINGDDTSAAAVPIKVEVTDANAFESPPSTTVAPPPPSSSSAVAAVAATRDPIPGLTPLVFANGLTLSPVDTSAAIIAAGAIAPASMTIAMAGMGMGIGGGGMMDNRNTSTTPPSSSTWGITSAPTPAPAASPSNSSVSSTSSGEYNEQRQQHVPYHSEPTPTHSSSSLSSSHEAASSSSSPATTLVNGMTNGTACPNTNSNNNVITPPSCTSYRRINGVNPLSSLSAAALMGKSPALSPISMSMLTSLSSSSSSSPPRGKGDINGTAASVMPSLISLTPSRTATSSPPATAASVTYSPTLTPLRISPPSLLRHIMPPSMIAAASIGTASMSKVNVLSGISKTMGMPSSQSSSSITVSSIMDMSSKSDVSSSCSTSDISPPVSPTLSTNDLPSPGVPFSPSTDSSISSGGGTGVATSRHRRTVRPPIRHRHDGSDTTASSLVSVTTGAKSSSRSGHGDSRRNNNASSSSTTHNTSSSSNGSWRSRTSSASSSTATTTTGGTSSVRDDRSRSPSSGDGNGRRRGGGSSNNGARGTRGSNTATIQCSYDGCLKTFTSMSSMQKHHFMKHVRWNRDRHGNFIAGAHSSRGADLPRGSRNWRGDLLPVRTSIPRDESPDGQPSTHDHEHGHDGSHDGINHGNHDDDSNESHGSAPPSPALPPHSSSAVIVPSSSSSSNTIRRRDRDDLRGDDEAYIARRQPSSISSSLNRSSSSSSSGGGSGRRPRRDDDSKHTITSYDAPSPSLPSSSSLWPVASAPIAAASIVNQATSVSSLLSSSSANNNNMAAYMPYMNMNLNMNMFTTTPHHHHHHVSSSPTDGASPTNIPSSSYASLPYMNAAATAAAATMNPWSSLIPDMAAQAMAANTIANLNMLPSLAALLATQQSSGVNSTTATPSPSPSPSSSMSWPGAAMAMSPMNMANMSIFGGVGGGNVGALAGAAALWLQLQNQLQNQHQSR